jgi:excisionase family DNA binding protein
MSDNVELPANLPNLAGYVSIREAAKMLGLARKTVYQYVAEGRIQGVRAGDIILVPTEEVEKFKRGIAGRPRTSIPIWRISPKENMLSSMLIFVQIKAEKQEALEQTLDEIKQERLHLFPGTVARYIIRSDIPSGHVHILLIWRNIVMPNEEARRDALDAFRQELADVLDWNTAKYDEGTVLIHT